MTTQKTGFHAERIFDGHRMHLDSVLLVTGDRIDGIVARADFTADREIIACDATLLVPGFVDLQVNGGGGVMFNDDPSVATLRQMAAAHLGLGATSILPTLITDTPAQTRAAIAATVQAVHSGVAGIIGLHLEGPHLSLSRKGAHDPALIRPMLDEDLELLVKAAAQLPVLMVTLAPENTTSDQVRALVKAGVIVSLGHSDAKYQECVTAINAGAQCVTHLFNAMSPLTSREPGLVGAALRRGEVSVGVIADLIHVDANTLAVALAAKQGPGQVFLVSDAMATAGSDIDRFMLNGRQISRRTGRLTLADGTLAGADLDLAIAVRNIRSLEVSEGDALAMATSIPARIAGLSDQVGGLFAGAKSDFLGLDAALNLVSVWQNGCKLGNKNERSVDV